MLLLLCTLLLFEEPPPQNTFVTRSITEVLPTTELLTVDDDVDVDDDVELLECFRKPLIRFVNSALARSTIVFCDDIFIGILPVYCHYTTF